MIYILVGNDTKKKSSYIKKISQNTEIVKPISSEISLEFLSSFAGNQSLFGNYFSVITENVLKGDINFSKESLSKLHESKNIFIFLEDKLLLNEEKKYNKYALIEKFEVKEAKQAPKVNTFAIADSFARRDKISTWILYRESIEKGIEPEAISGILFWKIKTMILNGNKLFKLDELKRQSSKLLSLYHKSHRGEGDFVISLEQFILSSLSK